MIHKDDKNRCSAHHSMQTCNVQLYNMLFLRLPVRTSICKMVAQFLFFLLIGGIGYDVTKTTATVATGNNKVPKIMMLRRQIRNFVPGRRATITVVYQASDPLTLRWFRHTNVGPRPFSELPNMLPAIGDPRFDNSSIYAGNVVATTFVIRRVDDDPFPAKYTLVISGTQQPVSYQLETNIVTETPHQRDTLDAMYWTTPPAPTVTFGYKGEFEVSCTAMLDAESPSFLDELSLYRSFLDKPYKHKKRPRLQSISCGKIHRDSSEYKERGGNEKYLYFGRRQPIKYGYARYRVGIVVSNATREDQGMYTCAMERVQDRMYASSWVQQGELMSKPIIEFLPCEAHQLNEKTETLIMVENKESCFRCRGYGYPYASMTMLKDGWPLVQSSNLLIETHLSVAEGGLSEITVTFLHPTYMNSGRYECKAENDADQAEYKFRLAVVKY